MDRKSLLALQTSYDRVADEYVRRIAGELEHKPFDRDLLDRFADRVRGAGIVADLGCGPGHVARYLHDRGVRVLGVDLSPGMIERARGLHPAIDFRVGNFTALDVPDGAWAGVVAFYSLIHVPRLEIERALRGLHRVLQPGGLLLAAFHLGTEVEHADELWGAPVQLDFVFYESAEMSRYLDAAGFEIDQVVERDPYPDVEVATRRGYILARG